MKRNNRKRTEKKRIIATPRISAGASKKKTTAKKVPRSYAYASLAARF